MNGYLQPGGTAFNVDDNVVPFRPRRGQHRQDRVIVLVVKAPDLKMVILDAYFDGKLTRADVEDLFKQYGLRND
jgi:hypothetical protein